MRYEDASHTGAFQGSQPIANDDLDSLPAGSKTPATGNLISGEGTQTGSAGADVAPGAHVAAIAGKGGEDTSFSGGKLSISGEHGRLSVDAEGNYIYQANAGVENVRDRFTYTLADNNGATDTGALIVEIGKTPVVIKANAQQIVPGPDGVVTLPPGVELSDVRVVGRNLVIDMPDGTQLIIIDGAIFVPQLVLNGVEIPSTNLAALLIGQEPQPAAGEAPQSGGGNFDVPVPPLDPGVPLGDLIPPTEYDYTPPEPEEVFDIVDRDPEITIQPDGQPASVNAVDSVDEAGLPERNEGEPEGSGEEAAAGDNGDTSEATGGVIHVSAPDGLDTVTINGVVVTGAGQVIAGEFGSLLITSVSGSAIGYIYTLDDNTSGDDTHDDFEVVVTDDDGDTATATLTIDIIDDVPTARNDTDATVNGVATGNVMTDAAPGDAGDSDTNAADTVGADNATLTAVSGAGGSDSTFEGGLLSVNGQFGVLTIDAQGNYTYTVNPNAGGGGVDVFTYTLTDGDGDTTTATLTITNPDLVPDLPNPDAVLLDDDALANGNPGGTGDDVDSQGTPGQLVGSGGDGDLDYFFSGSNSLPAGFTTNLVNASTLQILQGGTVVLTVTLNNDTGAFTVVQNAPIDHPVGFDENNLSFGVGVQVQDDDGDTEGATITINVDDDTPVVDVELDRQGAVTVDESGPTGASTIDFGGAEGDDGDVAGSGPIGRAVGATAIVDANALFGADGPSGSGLTYSLQLGGSDTDLTLTDGSAIELQLVNGVIVGMVTEGPHAGEAAFAIAINPASGVATVELYLSLDHPDVSNPNDALPLGPDTVDVVVSATDGDGDTSTSGPVDVSGLFNFLDDGPSVDAVLSTDGPAIVDESPPVATPTIDTGPYAKGDDPDLVGGQAIGSGSTTLLVPDADFGADGPAASDSLTFALTVINPSSGLTLTDGSAINLVLLPSGVVVGVVSGGPFDGQAAFAISVNSATGVVTAELYLSLDHPVNPDPNDVLSLAAGSLGAVVTATDGDGDTATSGVIDVGGRINFLDDGPAISPVVNAQATVQVDESLPSGVPAINTGAIVKGDDPDLAGGLAIGQANSGAAVVNANAVFGADGPAAGGGLTYALSISNPASGVTLTDGSAINLQLVGGVIVGVVASGAFAGQAAFAIAIDPATGIVSVEQYLSLDHPVNPNPDDVLGLGTNTVAVTVSGTDGDGDPVTSGAVDISGLISFRDDGPTIDPVLDRQATVEVDESLPSTAPAINTGAIVKGDDPDLAGGLALGQANSGAAIVDANAVFGADGPAAGGGISYALSITNVSSGVTLTDGSAINLQLVGGVIVGVVASGAFAGQAAFAIAIDPSTGVVTVEQYLSLDHPVNPNPDDVLGLGEDTIAVTVTATDGDGDPVTSGAIDISGNISFRDDGPTVDPTVNANATVEVDESLPSTAPAINTGIYAKGDDPDLPGGLALGQANSGSAVVNANAVFGADGPSAGSSLSYALSIINPASGVTLTDGSAINLVMQGGVIVGVVAAGAFAGQAAFAIAINPSTGVVSVEQYLSLDHPLNPDPNDLLGLGDNTVGVTVTATDGDGDPVTSGAVDISGQISFRDDGPVANNDVDSIVGGVGPATGNVITGVDSGGGDANGTDGVADQLGADGPGTITAVTSNNVPANVDTDPGANFTIAGQYGVLTLNANGSYSYLRNVDAPGGVEDVFTYTVTDGDGDPTTATLTIGIEDNFPNLPDPALVRLDDDALAGGNPAGTGDDPNSAGLPGQLVGSGGDGALTYNFTGVDTLPAGFTVNPVNATTVQILQGATVVLTVTLNQATGAFNVVQNNPIDHLAGANENNFDFSIGVEVEDSDGDVEPASITINVDDDTPLANNDSDTVSAGTAVGNVITGVGTTEGAGNADSPGADGFGSITNLVSNGTANSDGNPAGGFTVVGTYGTLQMDAAGSYTYTRAAGTPGGVSEQFTYTYVDGDGDTVSAVLTIGIPNATPLLPDPALVRLDDDALPGGNPGGTGDDVDSAGLPGQLVGSGGDGDLDYNFTGVNTLPAGFTTNVVDGSTVQILQGATVVMTVTLNNETGAFNVVQNNPIDHLAGNAENNYDFSIGVEVEDVDGDVEPAAITINVDDDTPTLGTIQNQTASNNPADPFSIGTLHFDVGADVGSSVTAISATNTGITSGGFNLVTNVTGNVLTAYQDVNGNGSYDAGDTTAVYTLTVNPDAGTSGQYVFNLITPLDPTVTETAIGGSSSFGAGPTAQGQVLENVAGTADLAVVSGYHMTGTFNEATWLATGNAGPAANYDTAGVNGSTAGWGIDNNNFNGTDEMFVWDFGSQALRDPDGAGPAATNYAPPAGVTLPDISTATFDLIGYGAPGDDISYVVHYTDGTFDSGHIPAVDMNDGTWKFTADPGKFIADIEMFTSGTGSGKVDLVSVGIQDSNLTETINFNVTISDADGDTVSGGFTVDVTAGGSPQPPAAMAPLSTKVSSTSLLADSEGQVQKTAANSNTLTVAAAVAAAGVVEAQAAAAPAHDNGARHQGAEMADLGSHRAVARAVESDGEAGSAVTNETREAANDSAPASSSNRHSAESQPDHALDNSAAQADAPSSSVPTANDQGPASSSVEASPAALAVGMPSVEALQAAGVAGNAQQGGSVEQIVADALGQGNASATVDALLNALPGGNGAVGALANLASPAANAVPGGDMSLHGGFATSHDMMFNVHAAMQHHDAVQPVANG